MALHNKGDCWIVGSRARQGEWLYVSMHQSPSGVMPFRSQTNCRLAFMSYLLMLIYAPAYHVKIH